jgi:hypothetical protein
MVDDLTLKTRVFQSIRDAWGKKGGRPMGSYSGCAERDRAQKSSFTDSF